MKLKTILLGLLLAVITAGCASTLTKTDPGPRTVSQPIISVDPLTQQPVITGYTNVTVTGPQYQVSPAVSSSLEAWQAVMLAGAAVPSPASPFLALGGGLLGSISILLGVYAKRKSGELTLSNAALAATTTVIETANNAADLKETVRQAATANGSQDYLHNKVKGL